MTKLDMYWSTNPEWYHYDENLNAVMNDDAPEEAKESYRHYWGQKKSLREEQRFYDVRDNFGIDQAIELSKHLPEEQKKRFERKAYQMLEEHRSTKNRTEETP